MELNNCESFIVFLTSDSSSSFYNNNQSDFTVNLCEPLKFNKPYEVALSEIIIPTSLYNINDNRKVTLYMNILDESIEILSVYLTSRLYTSEIYLINHILEIIKGVSVAEVKSKLENMLFTHYKKRIKVIDVILPTLQFEDKYVSHNVGNVYMTYKNEKVSTTLFWGFDQTVHQMLGYGVEQKGKYIGKAKYIADVYCHVHNLFIYTDIVNQSLTRDSKSSLLRVLNFDYTNAYKNITKSTIFNPLLFIPLNKHYIDNINIKISDYSGNPVKFYSGQVIVTLVFKPLNRS